MKDAATGNDVLLAVDVGLRSGMALYGDDGRLKWYRSHNYGTTARLKQGVRGVFSGLPTLKWLVLEGGGRLVRVWEKEAARRAVTTRAIHAAEWRKRLLLPRSRRSGDRAKQEAAVLARRIITWSGAEKPTSLRHDAAEAIAVGLYGVLEAGWLETLPADLKPV